MFFAPFPLIFSWLLGLLSLALLGGGLALVWGWYTGALVGTSVLVAGLAMTAWTFLGRWLVLLLRPRGGGELAEPAPASVLRLERPDGAVLHVETHGPTDAPTLLLTHGASANATSWNAVLRRLADRYRVVTWDMPGLGRSRGPSNADYSLEQHARHLAAVLDATVSGPCILVGHSMGGMVTLTFCRLFPEHLGTRVAGLALVDSSHVSPILVTTASGLLRALQRPLIEPLLHLTVWLSPLLWLTSWLSYLNGSTHVAAMLLGFAGSETREQLDLAALYNAHAAPAVQARENLAMLRYDASDVLPRLPLPALALTGHLDRLIVPETARTMGAAMPRGEAVTLTPGGHMVLFERSAEVAAALDRFAGSVLAAQARQAQRAS